MEIRLFLPKKYPQMNDVYRKNVVFSSSPVKGFYRYKDLFQIYPVPVDAPKPTAQYADHPFIIEYNLGQLDSSDIATISLHQSLLQREILALLTLCAGGYFFSYSNGGQGWYIPMGEGHSDIVSTWGQETYITPCINYTISEFSSSRPYHSIKKVSPNSHYDAFELALPDDIDKLFKAYYALLDKAKKAFQSALLLFHESFNAELRSVSLALLVSCIESLIHFEHSKIKTEHCSECKQPRYQTTKKFKAFMHEYGVIETKENKKYVDALYEARSNILHAGGLFVIDKEGPFLPYDSDPNSTYQQQFSMSVETPSIVRVCLTNWLFSQGENTC